MQEWAWGSTGVLEMTPRFPSLLLNGASLDSAFLLSPPLAGTGQTRDPGAQASPQRRTRLGFSKERAKRNLGVPWTLLENCYARLWLLIYWLMGGLYDPLTVLYETGVRSPTLPTASSIWREEDWG